MLSGNFVQRRMDRSIILINGSFSNILLQLLTEWFRAKDSFVLNKFEQSFIKSLKSCSKFSRSIENWTLISIVFNLTCTSPGPLTSHKNNF